jgi:phage terminase small subunit
MAIKLDPKHKRLADRYLVHLNAARAAREAGYSTARAKATAYDILSRDDVQLYLADEFTRLEKLNRARAFRVFEELAIVGHSSLEDYVVQANGNVRLAKGVPKEAWRAVASIEVKQIGPIRKTKIRLWPKEAALRMEGQALAMFKDVVETRDKTLEDALDELDDADAATS